MEKEILVNFLEILFINSFTTSSAKFNKFDIRSKVTARPSYARSRVVMRINIENEIWKLSKSENVLQRFSCISVLFKPP